MKKGFKFLILKILIDLFGILGILIIKETIPQIMSFLILALLNLFTILLIFANLKRIKFWFLGGGVEIERK